jgi:serine/threonine protein phosphatase PrpC
VFAEPELEFRYLGPHDSFLIIASDGVFEFISSQRVVDMVSRKGGQGGGVRGGCN